MATPRATITVTSSTEFLRFALVGALGTVVNTATLWMLHSGLNLHYMLAAAMATEVAIVHNFIGNDRLTFRDRRGVVSTWQRFLRFQLLSLTTVAGTLTLLWAGVSLLGERYVLAVNVAAIGVMFVANFVLNRVLTWRGPDARPLDLRASEALSWVVRRYGTHTTARIVCVAVLGAALGSAGVMFATNGPDGSALGPHLGADFAAFYAAGVVQQESGVGALYDAELHDAAVHRAVPGLAPDEHLPYAYPPFMAPLWRLLALLPYAWAFGVWLIISAAAYITGVWFIARTLPLAASERLTVWLAALAFPPFVIETWLGGQLAGIAVLSVGATLALWRRGAYGYAGFALALLAFKPTLLLLPLAAILVLRAWRALAGLVAGGAVLAIVSLWVAGRGGITAYLGRLLAYGETGGSAAWRVEKYVDVGAFLTLLGAPTAVAQVSALLLIASAVAGLVWLAHQGGRGRALVWPVAILLVPVASVYGPVYDAAVAVPALLAAYAATLEKRIGAIGMLVFAAALVTSLATTAIGLQLLTPVMTAAGVWLVLQGRTRSEVA